MSSVILGAPQKAAGTALVGIVVTLGAKGNAEEAVKLSNTLLSLGNDLAQIESADPATILNAATAATANLDPALGLALSSLLIANANLVAGIEQLEENTVAGSLVQSWITNFSAGMVAGATAELAKWTPKLPKAAAAPGAAE